MFKYYLADNPRREQMIYATKHQDHKKQALYITYTYELDTSFGHLTVTQHVRVGTRHWNIPSTNSSDAKAGIYCKYNTHICDITVLNI
jgi:hypothetical protein